MRALAPAREDRFQSAEEMRQALSDVMAEIAPRADTERVASFVRGLYEDAIREEREEREKLLAEPVAGAAAPRRRAAARRRAAVRAPTTPPGRAARRARTRGNLAGGARARQGAARAAPGRPAVPGLAFPREEESLGVDFAGRVIDSRYRVLRKIGEGGMGTVYAAEHVEIGKVVAIKILHPAYSTRAGAGRALPARGARRLAHRPPQHHRRDGLRHDRGRLRLLHHGAPRRDRSRRRAVARAAPRSRTRPARSRSRSAARWRRRTRPASSTAISSPRTSSWSRATARRTSSRCSTSASRAAPAGRRRLTNPGIAMGTPEYMAPEQAAGGVVDHRGDIYSVGALLYEMVTGQPPQKRDGELVGAARRCALQLSEDLDRIVVRALAHDPAQRYQSMAQLEYDLVKTLWGRTRAVADLLGLHQAEARSSRRRTPSTVTAPSAPTLPQEESLGDAVLERLDARRLGRRRGIRRRPPGRRRRRCRRDGRDAARRPAMPTPPPLVLETPPPPPDARGRSRARPVTPRRAPQFRSPPRRLRRRCCRCRSDYDAAGSRARSAARPGRAGRRFLATFAVLALAGVAAVRIYGKLPLPWNMRGRRSRRPRSAPARDIRPSPGRRRAAPSAPGAGAPPGRAAAAGRPSRRPSGARRAGRHREDARRRADVRAAAGAGEARLAALRRDGAGSGREGSRRARRRSCSRGGGRAREGRDRDRRRRTTRSALARSDAPEQGREALARRARARDDGADRAQGRRAGRALGARRRDALGNDDADAHALLADTLYAAKEYKDSVDEYRLALAGKPDDATLKRGLERARKKVGADKPARPRAKARVAKAPAARRRARRASPTRRGQDAPPSAPAEPAADEQK